MKKKYPLLSYASTLWNKFRASQAGYVESPEIESIKDHAINELNKQVNDLSEVNANLTHLLKEKYMLCDNQAEDISRLTDQLASSREANKLMDETFAARNASLDAIWKELYAIGCAPPSGSHVEGLNMLIEGGKNLKDQVWRQSDIIAKLTQDNMRQSILIRDREAVIDKHKNAYAARQKPVTVRKAKKKKVVRK